MFIVDHLLDILTGNEHRKTSHYIAEQKMLRKEDELLESTYNDLEEVEENDKQVGIEDTILLIFYRSNRIYAQQSRNFFISLFYRLIR